MARRRFGLANPARLTYKFPETMKIKHPAVKSAVFKLTTTLEFDLELPGDLVPTRIELLQDTERKTRWRARVWERESCRLESTFAPAPPPKGRKPAERFTFDEEILVERTWELSEELEDFQAGSAASAMKKVLDLLTAHLDRSTIE